VNVPADPRPHPHRRSIDVDREYFESRLHPKGSFMRNWDPSSAFSGRRSSTGSDMRASDTERNEVADKLSRHFSEGRLDAAEFKERLDTAMAAKTRGDLHGLFDDLPTLRSAEPVKRQRRSRLIPFLLIMAFVTVAAGISLSSWPFIHVPWVLVVIAALYIWHRTGGRHRHLHHHHDALES
jgi:uncharacterized protein DUF1707